MNGIDQALLGVVLVVFMTLTLIGHAIHEKEIKELKLELESIKKDKYAY